MAPNLLVYIVAKLHYNKRQSILSQIIGIEFVPMVKDTAER